MIRHFKNAPNPNITKLAIIALVGMPRTRLPPTSPWCFRVNRRNVGASCSPECDTTAGDRDSRPSGASQRGTSPGNQPGMGQQDPGRFQPCGKCVWIKADLVYGVWPLGGCPSFSSQSSMRRFQRRLCRRLHGLATRISTYRRNTDFPLALDAAGHPVPIVVVDGHHTNKRDDR